MVNENRIVPVEKIDLLSLYFFILKKTGGGNAPVVMQPESGSIGHFEFGSTGNLNRMASEPVRSLNFTASSGNAYFIVDANFEGITVNGVPASGTSAITEADYGTAKLFKAALSNGTVVVTNEGGF